MKFPDWFADRARGACSCCSRRPLRQVGEPMTLGWLARSLAIFLSGAATGIGFGLWWLGR
jgi:hypothetical protein